MTIEAALRVAGLANCYCFRSTRVKGVEPGVGFGPKRAPTQGELDWIDALWPPK